MATTDWSGRTQWRAEKTGIVEQVTRWQDSRTGQKGGSLARKVPFLDQNFQHQKHPVKKDVAIPGSQTSGVPVLLSPQLQPQEEPLHGMA